MTSSITADEYKTLIESFAQAVWETDSDGKVVSDSPSWRAYTGQTLEEWMGEGWIAAVHPEDRAEALNQWQQAVIKQQPVNIEFRLRSPDGGWRWTNVRATFFPDSAGLVKKWVGVNFDISDKKKAQEELLLAQQQYQSHLEEQVASRTAELEKSQQLLQATLDSSLDMIQVFEAVRDEEGEIIDFVWTLNNHASENVYGDIIGKRLLELNPGVKDTGIFDTFKRVIETGISDQSERHYVHEQFDGWFYQSTVKLGDGVTTTTTNITERKKAEHLIRESEERYRMLSRDLEKQVQLRTEELAAANEELLATNEDLAASIEELRESTYLLSRSNENLQQFAYVASHDLQEPLRKIQQFGDILEDQYGPKLGEGVTYLNRMQQAAGRMSTLIRDLLTYSRIATQRETSEAVNLQDVVNSTLTDLELVIAESGAHVEVATLPTIMGNSLQLGQLFQNLLSNALKFRKEGASPLIQVRAALIDGRDLPAGVKPGRGAQGYHLIEVADNGVGFNMEHEFRIFQVFQRLHGRSEYAGTGIGLAICQKVAENHGGVIIAQSLPGEGATFKVYLPQ